MKTAGVLGAAIERKCKDIYMYDTPEPPTMLQALQRGSDAVIKSG
jgi:hypothetical protein